MTPRERVNSAINHKEPDRVPVDLGGTACSMTENAYIKIKDYLKLDGKGVKISLDRVVLKFDEEILNLFNIDFRRVWLKSPESYEFHLNKDGTFLDEWGVKKKLIGSYAEIVKNPLKEADLFEIKKFPLPNPFERSRVKNLEEEVKYLYYDTDFAIVARKVADLPFTVCCYLRSYQQFLIDLVINKKLAHHLMGRVTDVIMGLYEVLLDIVGDYIQIVEFSDDYATQQDLLISPTLYREMIKPYNEKIIKAVKRKTKAKLFLHSCGSVYKLIPEFIQSGIDILNPIQPLAKGMDPERLKREFGNKIVFHGGIDIQYLLPYGSPSEIQREVKRRIEILGSGGGYILAPSHNIQEDTPPKNVVTMFEAATKS